MPAASSAAAGLPSACGGLTGSWCPDPCPRWVVRVSQSGCECGGTLYRLPPGEGPGVLRLGLGPPATVSGSRLPRQAGRQPQLSLGSSPAWAWPRGSPRAVAGQEAAVRRVSSKGGVPGPFRAPPRPVQPVLGSAAALLQEAPECCPGSLLSLARLVRDWESQQLRLQRGPPCVPSRGGGVLRAGFAPGSLFWGRGAWGCGSGDSWSLTSVILSPPLPTAGLPTFNLFFLSWRPRQGGPPQRLIMGASALKVCFTCKLIFTKVWQ